MKKYFFAFMFLFMLAFAMFGCTKDEPVEINLAIDLSEVNIKVGETATVVATITGTDVEPTWESADASIATVVNGVITGAMVNI